MDTGEHLFIIVSYYFITDEEHYRLTKGFCRRGFSDSEISYLKEVILVLSILCMPPKQLHHKQSSPKKKFFKLISSVKFSVKCLYVNARFI